MQIRPSCTHMTTFHNSNFVMTKFLEKNEHVVSVAWRRFALIKNMSQPSRRWKNDRCFLNRFGEVMETRKRRIWWTFFALPNHLTRIDFHNAVTFPMKFINRLRWLWLLEIQDAIWIVCSWHWFGCDIWIHCYVESPNLC